MVKSVPSVSVTYARNGSSTKANALGMRPMQERAYERRGEQYLADQVAAGLGQEPRADVHCSRQIAQSGAPPGDHRRA
jgi:hypothetical protein